MGCCQGSALKKNIQQAEAVTQDHDKKDRRSAEQGAGPPLDTLDTARLLIYTNWTEGQPSVSAYFCQQAREPDMKKTLIFSTLMMGSMTAHAAMQQMDDAEMSEVRG